MNLGRACAVAVAIALGGCSRGSGDVSIHAIQGAGHVSPHAGGTVIVRGIVTGTRPNGFYLQDPDPDADPATSEAIFVFTGRAAAVTVGDDLTAVGPVAEFRPGCFPGCAPGDSAFSNLSTTELDRPVLRINSHDHPLPPPVVLGVGGRNPPVHVLAGDASGDIETGRKPFAPTRDAIDFFESLEGMRVQLDDAVAVGPTRRAGAVAELALVGDGGGQASLRSERGGLVIAPDDFNPERIILASAGIPGANVGDFFPGAIVGVIDYNLGNFKLVPTEPLPALSTSNLARETLSLRPPGPADLRIAAFNVNNLDAGDLPARFNTLAGIIVGALRSPDLLALEEVQDNDGAKSSGVIAATQTSNRLVAAISAAGGPVYQWRAIDPVDGQDGGEPGGNIRVGFLFRSDRGLTFVDRPGATPLTANAVVSKGGAAALAFSPGRIDPTNPAFAGSRKPLAAELTFRGITLFAIANHFNARLGDQPLFGRFQPPALASAVQRLAQAQVLAGFVRQLLSADADARVIALGDLNDFEFSPVVAALEAAGLTTLIKTLPPRERYTYLFEGNSQALDHVLVSPRLAARVAGFDVVHVNAEFAIQASDHDPSVVSLTIDPR
jgi:predicted extracellular nuclease